MPECFYEVGVRFKRKIKDPSIKEDYLKIDGRITATCIEIFRDDKFKKNISAIMLGCNDVLCINRPRYCANLEKEVRDRVKDKSDELEIVYFKKLKF